MSQDQTTMGRKIDKKKSSVIFKAAAQSEGDRQDRLSNMVQNLPLSLLQLELWGTGSLHIPYIDVGVSAFLGITEQKAEFSLERIVGFLSKSEQRRIYRHLLQSRKLLTPVDIEVRLEGTNDIPIWVRFYANPVEKTAEKTIWDVACIDITAQYMLDERLTYLAYHDEITDLPNRLAQIEYLENCFNTQDPESFCLLALAIDRLDLINETMGIETADRLLKTISEILCAHFSADTFVSHPRADKFSIVLKGFGTEKQLIETLQALLEKLKIPFEVNNRRLDVSVSLGIAIAHRDGDDCENLMMNADTALRRALITSPGGYRFFMEEMNTRALRVLAYENRLRKAIEDQEFVPFYQPLIDMKTGDVASMEALVRWKHPRLGLVAPNEFIPVAEEAGLIGEICHQVLLKTCETLKGWLDEGLKVTPLAVNISWRQFAQPERLMRLMDDVLQQTGLPADLIELELTESSVMEEPDSAIKTLNDLKDFGVMASIDDFGTGYSSLSYLKKLPISKLKIDRAFIHEVCVNERDGAIVDAIIRLAQALGLKTVAEGIETQEQFESLKAKGCDLAQGFYFSRPVPCENMRDILVNGVTLE